ncbi:tryptophan halogenase family protein [Pseudoalteromonas sp. SaAl2]
MMIKKIVILGGGTAGWLTANHLGSALKSRGFEITLIESPNIPTIGVGEGTVPAIRKSLRSFGVSESEFIKECDVTFKQSIKFVNWLDKNAHGENHYHHLFDHPEIFGEGLIDSWLSTKQSDSFANYVSKQEQSCEKNLAPKLITTPEYAGINGYAYHFDAKKFAAFLGKHAVNHFSIKHELMEITDAELDCDGFITHLVTSKGDKVNCDFIVDCSGFKSTILGDKLGISFHDRSVDLLTDTALTIQVPTSDKVEIPPYTLATAHKAGWIWDITLTQRRGVGFVYSSKHMSEEEARGKLAKYLGLDDISPRKIPMKVGQREQFWHKNCVAIGLSQGFVEPLEATAILIADFSADLLSKRFPVCRDDICFIADDFNKIIKLVWDKTFDFIKMHYCISDRTDSPFWLANKDISSSTLTELKKNLTKWGRYGPMKEDFQSKFDLFDYENYLYVLYGMKYLPKNRIGSEYPDDKLFEMKKIKTQQIVNKLPQHRELLDKIKQYGLQSV